MKVSPISAEEADAGGGGEPFRPGDYDFHVYAAEDTISKQGNEMLKLTLHVFDRHGEKRTVFDYILSSAAGAWKARHLMETLGMIRQYDAGEINPHEIQGRPGLCKLGVEPASGTYAAKNKIVDYILSGTVPATQAAPAPRRAPATDARKPALATVGGGSIDGDEIPFGPCWQ
jgi:hypothetical protein